MNQNMLDQLASQRVAEIRAEVSSHRKPAAADREPRESLRERAGWTLIHAGLKLTDTSASRRAGGPRPASL
jgi:hypothetical protein